MAFFHDAVLDPAQFGISDGVVMGIERHGIVAGLKDSVADDKPLAVQSNSEVINVYLGEDEDDA